MKKLIVFAGCSLLVIVGLVCWLAVRSVKRTATVKSDSAKGRPTTGNFPGTTLSITISDSTISEINGQVRIYNLSDSMQLLKVSGSKVLPLIDLGDSLRFSKSKIKYHPVIYEGDPKIQGYMERRKFYGNIVDARPPNTGKVLFADSQRLALPSALFPALYRDTTHSFFPTRYVYSPRIDTFVIGDNAGNVSTFLRNGTVIWETLDKTRLDSVYRWFAINLLIEKEYMDSIKREEDKYKTK